MRTESAALIRALRASTHTTNHARFKTTNKGGPAAQAVKRIILSRTLSVAEPGSLHRERGDTYRCTLDDREVQFRFAVTASKETSPWFNVTHSDTESLQAKQVSLLVVWNRDDTWCKQLDLFCLPADELNRAIKENEGPILRAQLLASLKRLETKAPAEDLSRHIGTLRMQLANGGHSVDDLRHYRDSMLQWIAELASVSQNDDVRKKSLRAARERLITILLHLRPSPSNSCFIVSHKKTDTDLITIDETLSAAVSLSTSESLALEAAYSELTEIDDSEEDATEAIAHPYDPSKSKIDTRPLTIDLLVKRIAENEIDLSPPFQRKAGLWTEKQKSQLIESLLIRVPLPAFYFDATNASKWVVVDGLQRLTTFREFILGSMHLVGLEYLTQCNGKTFEDLPRPLRRDIEESQVTLHLIQPGTPPEVKFNIFRRVNTGGLVLTAQEIRHALNQGAAVSFLNDLANSPEFLEATTHSISPQRMADREFVLRFLGFTMTSYEDYKVADMDAFLSAQMARLNSEKARLKALRRQFVRAMKTAAAIFGKHAFRKRLYMDQPRSPINKALFEAWSVSLGQLSDSEALALTEQRDAVIQQSIALMRDDEFVRAISQGTADTAKVRKRFTAVESVIAPLIGATR